ncbi:MAG: family 20 glycosylhydrolase [Lentisphaerota bacterium]
MENMGAFQFRGVQLDLARQMETLDFIYEFMDFIGKSGYNTLVLYLEGRIKTKSFPYPVAGEYYTPEEMNAVVFYASKKNIDVIPVVSVLGHAELFLKHKEMKHLAEIRGDAKSTLEETINHVFCPSLPETFDFIKNYLSEIAAIFPSKYFHVGCDEVWDFGCCSICRDRIHNGESHGDIFAKYITDMHGFIKNELGKDMIVWDDLFECYPNALDKIPNDVILCCWNYDRRVDLPKAHFKSRLEEDLLAKYEKLGFKYIFAPSTFLVANIESFTTYSSKYSPLGGLLTVWEKSLNFMYEVMPLVHYAGRLWSGKDINFNDAIKDVFGCGDNIFLDALRSNYEIKATHPTRLSPLSYLAGPVTEFEAIIKSSSETNSDIFSLFLERCVNDNARNMLEDILVSLEWKKIMFKLRTVVEELYSFDEKCPDIARRKYITSEMAEMIDRYLKKKLDQWKRFRKGISSAGIEKTFTEFRNKVLELAETSAKAAGVLKVKFFLPDMYNAQKCKFTIVFEDGSTEIAAEGIFKNYEMNDAYFIYKFPYYTTRQPVSVRIESWLYGGLGIAYLEIISRKSCFYPVSICNVKGNVQSIQHILVNDLRFCYLGETDMNALLQMPELTKRKHGLTLVLGERQEE